MTLTVSEVTAGYSGSKVLDNVSFDIQPGEIVALLGRNGMGKSTLARSLAGSHPFDSGHMSLADTKVHRVTARKRFKMGLRSMRQEKPVIAGLTVRENLQLANVDVEQAVEFFPFIKERVNQDAGTLSGGEQKLLAMSRVASNPGKYWILDEPTEGLQPSNVDRCGQIIRDAAQAGCAVLLIEQHLNLALRTADRWMVMEKGAIVDQDDVKDDSHTRVTARLTM